MRTDAASAAKHAVDRLDPEAMIRDLSEMVNIPSGTGEEAAMARWMVNRLRSLGLDADLQEVSPGRYNALGRLRGGGGGRTLLLNGHLDTSYSGREAHLTAPGPCNQPRRSACDCLESGWYP